MKLLFYLGLAGFLLFEILNVYFIMPMPGSQRMESIDFAYFLYSWRWVFRSLFGLAILASLWPMYQKQRWVVVGGLVVLLGVIYFFNFRMSADHMFYQPEKLQMLNSQENKVKTEKLITGIVLNGEARAYPIQLIAYHHQVLDTVGGKPIMVTYCSVCRTGRIFDPAVNGKPETFRLVGMDHFNAMFEDATTGSWWRQATGEAITGERKGEALTELLSEQMTLSQWLALHPKSLIMQPDVAAEEKYKGLLTYEDGKSKGDLTRTDSLSWKDKSWVVGIEIDAHSKAFDWNRLKKERIINETIGNKPIVLVLANDNKSFTAFARPTSEALFTVKNDTLFSGNQPFLLSGQSVSNDSKITGLTPVNAYQEFWHSWQTFHPKTERY
ncbi:DUF3179 domain-containing (seleno)protein [Cytophagaceae bacterium DM2B3-1]|uniref:DUF3179 domain-containing (Seleno)protein n=1 Tax=Xanthocytophaga flava TaxID=3048013 RepID=A0ABT7CQA5_9BACT|nr:DUF3179 domain-containing (seleno)protein [Xanthocytophaga flavus]MDJ1495140.1 DUF3179 domain-containing (seleno)protein [Xanthocytophaga flavus]